LAEASTYVTDAAETVSGQGKAAVTEATAKSEAAAAETIEESK
jgi:hypothetical protein